LIQKVSFPNPPDSMLVNKATGLTALGTTGELAGDRFENHQSFDIGENFEARNTEAFPEGSTAT